MEKSGKIGSNNVVEILETLIGKGLTEHEQEIVKGEISFYLVLDSFVYAAIIGLSKQSIQIEI